MNRIPALPLKRALLTGSMFPLRDLGNKHSRQSASPRRVGKVEGDGSGLRSAVFFKELKVEYVSVTAKKLVGEMSF